MPSRIPQGPATSTPHPPRPTPRGPSPANPAGSAPIPGGGRGSWTTPKRVIWTGAFAAVTVVGAIYGAGLKTQQEYKAEKQQIIEATPEERIQILETRRAALVANKRPLEQKLEELRQRVRKEEHDARSNTNSNSDSNTSSRTGTGTGTGSSPFGGR